MLIWAENAVQPLRNELNPYLRSLLHMASRMEIVKVSGKIFHRSEVFRHSLDGKLPEALVCGTEVEGIGCVRDQCRKMFLFCQVIECSDIRKVDRFCFAAARIAGKVLEGVCSNGKGLLSHVQISL